MFLSWCLWSSELTALPGCPKLSWQFPAALWPESSAHCRRSLLPIPYHPGINPGSPLLPGPRFLFWGRSQLGGDLFLEQCQAQASEAARQEPTAELDALVLQPISTHGHGNFPPSKRPRKHLVRVILPSVCEDLTPRATAFCLTNPPFLLPLSAALAPENPRASSCWAGSTVCSALMLRGGKGTPASP